MFYFTNQLRWKDRPQITDWLVPWLAVDKFYFFSVFFYTNKGRQKGREAGSGLVCLWENISGRIKSQVGLSGKIIQILELVTMERIIRFCNLLRDGLCCLATALCGSCSVRLASWLSHGLAHSVNMRSRSEECSTPCRWADLTLHNRATETHWRKRQPSPTFCNRISEVWVNSDNNHKRQLQFQPVKISNSSKINNDKIINFFEYVT